MTTEEKFLELANKGKHEHREANHVMVKEFGRVWVMPDNVSEAVVIYAAINSTIQEFLEVRTSLGITFFNALLELNPDLRIFSNVKPDNKRHVIMGCASWLDISDIEYFINVPSYKRPKNVEKSCGIARSNYYRSNNHYVFNKEGFVECLDFVLYKTTSLKILDKYR
jgi:hypothetical protein